MTSKLTRERLEKIRSWTETYGAGSNVMLPAEEAEELARMMLAGMDSEPVAYTDERNLGYIDRGRETAYLWGKQNSEPADVALYRHAQQPVDNTFIPKNLDKALGVVGVALPESKEEFNFQIERWIQRLIDRVIRYSDEFKEQPAPVVPDERAAFNAWNNEDNLPIAGVGAKNAAWLAWQARAELAGNSPVIGIDPASGPDRTVEVSYVAPPGYVMVPKEPTPEMMAVINEAIKSMRGSAATYARVLAAAQQEVMKDEANNLSPK